MVDLLRFAPAIPIPGYGRARFQPMYIKDWVQCLESVLSSPKDFVSAYDLGGPEHLTYRQIVEIISRTLGVSRPIINVPMGLMKFSAALLEKLAIRGPVTYDQLRLLEQDNICGLDSVNRNFGFMPARLEDALREFVRNAP
jgi:NADH dehydrogenase